VRHARSQAGPANFIARLKISEPLGNFRPPCRPATQAQGEICGIGAGGEQTLETGGRSVENSPTESDPIKNSLRIISGLAAL
jgi:hypothetical protein